MDVSRRTAEASSCSNWKWDMTGKRKRKMEKDVGLCPGRFSGAVQHGLTGRFPDWVETGDRTGGE